MYSKLHVPAKLICFYLYVILQNIKLRLGQVDHPSNLCFPDSSLDQIEGKLNWIEPIPSAKVHIMQAITRTLRFWFFLYVTCPKKEEKNVVICFEWGSLLALPERWNRVQGVRSCEQFLGGTWGSAAWYWFAKEVRFVPWVCIQIQKSMIKLSYWDLENSCILWKHG